MLGLKLDPRYHTSECLDRSSPRWAFDLEATLQDGSHDGRSLHMPQLGGCGASGWPRSPHRPGRARRTRTGFQLQHAGRGPNRP